jgi:predicted O-linked N-acetylglucosamine transferase (SPINDLY family)
MQESDAPHAKSPTSPQGLAADTLKSLHARMVAEGVRLHRAERLVEAESAYRSVLAADPHHADALHMLGVVAHQSGHFAPAIELIGQAIAINPHVAEYHANLGSALKDIGNLALAEQSYRMALQALPAFPEVLVNLGLVLQAQGRSDEAAAWAALAAVSSNKKDYIAAVRALEEVLRCDPTATWLKPHLAAVIDKIAMDDIAAGRNAEASRKLARAAGLNPDSADIQFHLGCALQAVERYDDAIAAYRQSTGLRPGFAPAWNNLANSLRFCRRLDEAIESFRRALSVQGNLDGIRSNILLTMNYAEGISAELFFAEHLEFERTLSSRAIADGAQDASESQHANMPDPARRLRVAYVSADFRAHPLTRFLEPILANHDDAKFEIFCYSCSTISDEFTRQIRAKIDQWRSFVGLNDEAAAQLVRDDSIDILVDLAGHTGANRLPVFAHKPAPVQVTYLGYPATTGLAAIDYKIVDRLTAPLGRGLDELHTELLWRLEGPMWAYSPQAGMPAVSPPPATRAGFVTFGSFNTIIKLGSGAVRAWAEILRAVPGSRLRIATVPEGETRAQLNTEFASLGIEASRLTFHARLEPGAFWELHAATDIALDTFPCNGGTTTFETLWMGVPVIALAGADNQILVSHVSAGILRGLALDELIGSDHGDYVRRAVELARDPVRLANLRAELRGRLSASPYLDHAGFTADLEGAYRAMWQRWCVDQTENVRRRGNKTSS